MTIPPPPSWDGERDGRFPFGRPNTPRPARTPSSGHVRQLVIGVYPSALHVSWTRPASEALPTRQRRVASMAVDVEPEVFWDGKDADTRVAAWVEQVGFRAGYAPEEHGVLGTATNGPSGDTLNGYFDGLAVSIEDTAFLDVYPVFLVKRRGSRSGAASHREQGDAIDEVYNAAFSGLAAGPTGPWTASNLPTRFSATELPRRATERFGTWLRDVLLEATPEHVVTLGQEPWTTLSLIPGVSLNHPAPSLSATRLSGYGTTGSLTVDGHDLPWTPLAHPGLLRQSTGDWAAAHSRWARRLAT